MIVSDVDRETESENKKEEKLPGLEMDRITNTTLTQKITPPPDNGYGGFRMKSDV